MNKIKHILKRLPLFLMLLITSAAGGQTDYTGTYYIGTAGYNASTPTTNYYLCPTEGWIYYKPTNEWSTDGTTYPNPFLTTYRCKTNNYHSGNSSTAVWYVEKHPTLDYYYIKHASDGKYVLSNGQISGTTNANRMRVHLEAVTGDPDERALFSIAPNSVNPSYLVISPKSSDGWNGDFKWYTVNNGNKNYLVGNASNGGPTGYTATGGIIGLYTETDNNAKFYLESAISIGLPTVTNNYTAENTFTIATAEGATIYYTTDGTTPTTDTPTYGTTSVNITQTESMTVIKAIAKATSDNFPTPVVTYFLPVCQKPVISASGGNITITCSTAGATIHYTTDGTPATASSPTYNGSFVQGDISTIRAVATKAGYVVSSEATLMPATPVSYSSEITDMSGNYILLEGFSSTAPIGTLEAPFMGTIDGDMVTISGLDHPLVAYTQDAVIKNVILDNVNISSDADAVGAIACVAKGYTRIYNCGILPNNALFPEGTHPSVSTTGTYAGGIVGSLEDDSRVVNCFSYADVSADIAAGIVGNNTFASTAKETGGKYTELRTMVVNCMFYGNISAGQIYPVYGGAKITNKGATAINNYNYYRNGSTFTGTLSDYNCSWPAKEEYLTQYEYYRYLLNSNRELCGWWVGAPSAPSTLDATEVQDVPKNASLMAKWVLDPSIAPYPVLKPAGFHTSVINPSATKRIDATSKQWVNRAALTRADLHAKGEPKTEGQTFGTLKVYIDAGDHHEGSTSMDIRITAMDTINNDFCYGKIQLPYYNEVFGDPDGDTWSEKYAGNYTDMVVTGWDITNVEGGRKGAFTTHWQDGYNFADRKCTDKDKNRLFAQGGYYYVPDSVESITITAHWATATYIDNTDHSYDRVYFSDGAPSLYGAKAGLHFAPAGYRTAPGGLTVQNSTIASTIPSLSGGTVNDKALVLVGNHQYRASNTNIGTNASKGCTIMSADFDFDNEPDYCLEWQLGQKTDRYHICPIRFDFLPIVELGLAMKEDGSKQLFSMGCYRPLGHFEVTETTLIHFGQFEFGNSSRSADAPLILNGGIYDQYCKGTRAHTDADDHIDYVIIGGHVYIPSFAPGAHVNAKANFPTRHCAVNVIGGKIDNLYLTGNFNEAVTPNEDNPHCYIDGGSFKQIAAAGKEGINGDVTFVINHSIIDEFYGGSTLSNQLLTGNISVTIDNSLVTKYCGGPKFGNMHLDEVTPANNKTVTTNATGTTFGVYYGGGNGGTSYVQYDSRDNTTKASNYNWNGTNTNQGAVNNYRPGTYRNRATGYMADYEMEIVNTSAGTSPDTAVFRTYFYAAQFSATNTGPITNNINKCKVLTNFYGGGNLGGVIGNVRSILKDTEVQGSVFGAGFSAQIPQVTIRANDKAVPTVDINTGMVTPTPEGSGSSNTYTWTNDPTLSTTNPISGKYIFTEEPLDNLGAVMGNATLSIEGSTTVGGSVYGGGDESAVNGGTNIVLTEKAIIGNDQDGTGDVYGGGNVASVGGDTQINLKGGTVTGDVYGGGKGRLAADAVGTEGQPGYIPAVTPVAATVGAATVELNTTEIDNGNGTKSYPDSCVVKGRLFGCNNLNGTPLGAVTVHVQKTCGYDGHWRTGINAKTAAEREAALDNIDDAQHSYEVEAVYGGGNLAAYVPTDLVNGKTHVIIDGCELTSVRQVYGGGNAASTPAAWVEINGTYEIEEVFGGGNGKDDISRDGGISYIKNPGANVGFKDYWDYANKCDLAAYDTKEERQTSDFITNYVYGSGAANVNIHGGRIHRVYGGSNTKGNVRQIAVTMLEELSGCDFVVDEAYGGGKSASMDGQSKLEMACIPGLKNAYGGAENANINNDVTLNITNGNFNRIFGGNNVSGTINGTITVNIEETGCHHITIGQLYGGGNQAPYTGPLKTGSTTERQGPTLNVRSFSSIGEVYGGGYGKTATVTGDTYVNINVCDGKDFGANQTTELARTNTFTGNKTISFAEFRRTDDGGFALDNQSNRIIDYKTIDLYLPPFTSGIGVINNVYGGGNAAKVIGNTHVNIGTATDESVIFITPTSEPLDANRTHTVKGANIRGNVYGGGNAADVTGKTKVQIGKKME
jgi:hypothetical protein